LERIGKNWKKKWKELKRIGRKMERIEKNWKELERNVKNCAE
jgi:sulfur transfer protein SufE